MFYIKFFFLTFILSGALFANSYDEFKARKYNQLNVETASFEDVKKHYIKKLRNSKLDRNSKEGIKTCLNFSKTKKDLNYCIPDDMK